MSHTFTRTVKVRAIQVTPATTETEILEVLGAAPYIPVWMPEQRGWLVREGNGTINYVHPADFACDYEPVGEL